MLDTAALNPCSAVRIVTIPTQAITWRLAALPTTSARHSSVDIKRVERTAWKDPPRRISRKRVLGPADNSEPQLALRKAGFHLAALREFESIVMKCCKIILYTKI